MSPSRLVELRLRDFRNLARVEWYPAAGCQLLSGPNGAGKSSLLEAIYLAATTRSFRAAAPADCCRRGADAFHVAATIAGDGRSELAVGWARSGERLRTVNGHERPLAEHLAVQPVLAWTAADAELLTGPPAARRRFLDRGLVAARPAVLTHLSRCQRALRQKRELLLGGGEGLPAWNELLATEAAAVAAARAEHATRLGEALAPLVAASALDLPPIALVYRPSPECALGGAAAILTRLEAAAARERERGQPLLGPQRDELEIRSGGQPVRRFASAGERKALGLLLLAAQARVLAAAGREPLLLLDDADTELDPRRLAALWPALAGCAQLIASTNRPAVWEALALAARWHLEPGSTPVAVAAEGP